MGGSRLVLVRAVLLAAGCLCAAFGDVSDSAQAKPLRNAGLSLRLSPGVVEGPGIVSPGSSSARGTVRLRLPSAWGAPAIRAKGAVGHFHIALAPQCEAEVEATTWIGKTAGPIRLQIEASEDFWFELFAPEKPRPVPLVARHVHPGSTWELATPPTGSHGSPYYGTAARRLGSTRVWGVLHLGVRAAANCAEGLPGHALLQSQIESVLRTASFHLRAR